MNSLTHLRQFWEVLSSFLPPSFPPLKLLQPTLFYYNRFIYTDKRLCNVRRCSNDVKHQDENWDDLSWKFPKVLFHPSSYFSSSSCLKLWQKSFILFSSHSCFFHNSLKRSKSWGRFKFFVTFLSPSIILHKDNVQVNLTSSPSDEKNPHFLPSSIRLTDAS